MLQYAADFETTTRISDVRVWAFSIVNIDTLNIEKVGNDIEQFFDFIQNKNSIVYFHNLKFDGEFIIYWLFKNGFKYNETKEDKTFQTLISDTGEFYSIKIFFKKLKQRYLKCEIRDSLKKLPFTVAVIAKAFNLEISKLKISYTKHRKKGHELTDEERNYVVNDSMIIAQALNIQFKEKLTKMTIGSDALGEYKTLTKKVYFDTWFPQLPVDLDRDIRQAYKGGYTWLNPKFRNIHVHGIKYDVNSLYPSVMRYGLLPFGYPIPYEGKYEKDPEYPLFVQRIRCEFKLKKDKIPTIQLKNNRAFIQTQYLESSNDEIVDITLTSVDLKLFKEHYNIYNIEYVSGYKFRACKGFFNKYIDKWMKIKETTTGAKRTIAKLMLNSLYGKFSTNPYKINKHPYLDENDIVKYHISEPTIGATIYVPMGAFITALAREKTIRTAQSVYERFIYCDTDSIHLEGYEEAAIDIHPTKLGLWKSEGIFTDGIYLRPKSYMNTINKKDYVTCAGMPDKVKKKVNYNNFTYGSKFKGKLMPKHYPGGIILQNIDFTIKNDYNESV